MRNGVFRFQSVTSKVVDWSPESSDVENIVPDEHVLRCDSHGSYRGSKQKSPALMELMIEVCTTLGNVVLDLTAVVDRFL